MKFPILSCLLAGATLVSASPLRVVVISEGQGAGSSLRLGHPAAIHEPVAHIVHPPQRKGRMGCGARFREKTLAMSNTFRQALGMPLIETDVKAEGSIHILPFIGTPSTPTFVEVGPNDIDGKTRGGDKIKVLHRPHHHHRPGFRHAHESFLTRVHIALMTLGPWEGRAVAFVLGCGLGVLLRMLWVLSVVTYRAIRGGDDQSEYQHVLLFEQPDAEELVVPPPVYIVDEKVPIVEEPKAVDAN